MDETIRRYIEQAEEVRNARRAPLLSVADLRDIARQVGLNDADFESIDEEIVAHLARARNYLEGELFDDSLRELDDIAGLSVGRVDVTYLRACVHAARFEREPTSADRDEAVRLARSVLETDPGHRGAVALIKRVTTRPIRPPALDAAALGLAAGAVTFLITSSVLFAGVALFGAFFARIGWTHIRKPQPIPPLLPSMTPRRALVSGYTEVPISPQARSIDVEVPVVAEASEALRNLELTVRVSRTDAYEESAFHIVVMEVTNHGAEEISELHGRLEFLDEGGQPLHAMDVSPIHSTHDASVPPGATHVFEQFLQFPTVMHPAQVVLSASKIARERPRRYRMVRVQPESSDPLPPGIELEFRRLAEHEPSAIGWVRTRYDVRNTGSRPVKDLRLRIERRAPDGRLLDSSNNMMTYRERVLYPGELRTGMWLTGPREEAWEVQLVIETCC